MSVCPLAIFCPFLARGCALLWKKKKGGSGDNVRVHFVVDDALPLALVIRKLFQL